MHPEHPNKLFLCASKRNNMPNNSFCTIIRTHQVTGKELKWPRQKCDLCGCGGWEGICVEGDFSKK